MKKQLEQELEKIKKVYVDTLEKFIGNVYSQFAWCGEELFKLSEKMRVLNQLIVFINDNPPELVTKEKLIAFLTRQVMCSSQLMSRSSSQLHALTSLWTKEVYIELIEKITTTYFDEKSN